MKKFVLFRCALACITILIAAGCQKQNDLIQPGQAPDVEGKSFKNADQVNVFKGPEVQIGNGKGRSWISINHAGVPQEIGIELTDQALTGLPTDPLDFAAATFVLPLHQKAQQATLFDHITINWNVHGHEPEHVFDVPHFDFHFYMISLAAQTAIPPYDVAPAPFDQLPPPATWPDDFVPTPGGVPQMGKHWASINFMPPFSKTIIYGSFAGHFTFVEPMITLAYLQSGATYHEEFGRVKYTQPVNAFVPGQYNISYDGATKKHYITLSKFIWK